MDKFTLFYFYLKSFRGLQNSSFFRVLFALSHSLRPRGHPCHQPHMAQLLSSSSEVIAKVPENAFALILTFAAYSLAEVLEMRLVSKDFKMIISAVLMPYLKAISSMLKSNKISLHDPLFHGFTTRIPAFLPFKIEMIDSARDAHILDHFKRGKASQMDRVYGYMLENRAFFRKLFRNPEELENDPDFRRISLFRDHFIKYVTGALHSDKKFIYFLNLMRANVDFTREEKTFAGISHYFKKYGQTDIIWRLHRKYQVLPKLVALQRNLLTSPLITDRISQAKFFFLFTCCIDFFILFTLSVAFCDYALPFKSIPVIQVLIECILTAFGTLLTLVMSPTWRICSQIDSYIHGDEDLRENFKTL